MLSIPQTSFLLHDLRSGTGWWCGATDVGKVSRLLMGLALGGDAATSTQTWMTSSSVRHAAGGHAHRVFVTRLKGQSGRFPSVATEQWRCERATVMS